MRRDRLSLPDGAVACSTPVIVGAIGGAALGLALAFGHPEYPDQVVVSLATVGANLASRGGRKGIFSLGDVVLLTSLLLLTLTIAGWHLAGLAGLLVGVAIACLITRIRFRPD